MSTKSTKPAAKASTKPSNSKSGSMPFLVGYQPPLPPKQIVTIHNLTVNKLILK